MSKRAIESNDDVTDDDIWAALNVLDALRAELKAHTKRRIKRVADNEGWDAVVTCIEYELRGHLSSIYRLELELKHWRKRRIKVAQRSIPT
jgi:hypothetical protein